jgi:hypothetical protein
VVWLSRKLTVKNDGGDATQLQNTGQPHQFGLGRMEQNESVYFAGWLGGTIGLVLGLGCDFQLRCCLRMPHVWAELCIFRLFPSLLFLFIFNSASEHHCHIWPSLLTPERLAEAGGKADFGSIPSVLCSVSYTYTYRTRITPSTHGTRRLSLSHGYHSGPD